MGRQINFYFVEQDEYALLTRLKAEGVTFLRADLNKTQSCVVYEEFGLNPCGEASHSQTFICRLRDLNRLRLELSPRSSTYYLDPVVNPVIEFSRSGYNRKSNRLVSGRLWYEHKYWDKDKDGKTILVAKDEELKQLYDRLVKWIKKYCKRLPNGNYIAPHAAELYAKGAQLSP